MVAKFAYSFGVTCRNTVVDGGKVYSQPLGVLSAFSPARARTEAFFGTRGEKEKRLRVSESGLKGEESNFGLERLALPGR